MILLRKIANISLALTILLATTGVTLSKHYCLGRLKSISINEHASHCFGDEEEKMPCCEDVEEELKVEEITTVSYEVDLSPDLFQIAIITFVLSNERIPETHVNSVPFKDPPLPERDIQVLHQSFLI